MKARKTVFLHIGKAGGTSIHSALAFNLRKDKIFSKRVLYPGQENQLDAQSLQSCLLFSGHYYTPLLDYFQERPILITFLREPAQHFRSVRRQATQEPTDLWHRALNGLGESQIRGALAHVFGNLQTRTIHRFFYKDALDLENDDGYDSPEILMRVLRKICEFDIIGSIDDAPQLLQTYNAIGGTPAGRIEMINISPKDKYRSEFDVEYISEINSLDFVLYHRIKKAVKKAQDQRTIDRWLIYAGNAAQVVAAAKGIPSLLFGAGWYGAETDRFGGSARWSKGRELAVLIVYVPSHIAGTTQKLSMTFSECTIEISELRIFCEDVELLWNFETGKDSTLVVKTDVTVPSEGALKICIKTPSVSFYEIDNTSMQIEPRALMLNTLEIGRFAADHYFDD